MADEFIQEINEELQAERIRTIAIRIGIAVLVLLLFGGIGAGVWGWKKHTLHVAQAKASVHYMEAIQLRSNAGEEQKAVDIFSDLAAHGPQGVRSYAAMSLADIKKGHNDLKGALTLWQQVGGDQQAEPALQQMARYLSLNAQMDALNPDILRQGYQKIIQNGGSWASLAREGIAVLDMRGGSTQEQKDEAQRLLTQIKLSPESGEALRDRAGLLLQTLGDVG